ncbi:MAG: PQQ-binding-like beta-propeller repeat protein [Planctomycetota bacterium]
MCILSPTRTTWTLTVALGAALNAGVVSAADWPNFFGPKYDGISSETGFKKDWTTPIPVLWEREVGSAFSSFAVVGNRVYTCGMKDKQQVLYCLNADTGEVVWENAFEEEFRNEHGDGTRATPTVHEGLVYVLGARGRLLCVDAASGKPAWEKKFNHAPTWAYSGSVLIEGDLAVASAGKDDGSLVAFNRKTGEPAWKAGDAPAGYATPYPFTFNGKRYVTGFLGDSAMIVEAATGREVWRTNWKTDWDVNAAMPIFHDGYLFLASGYRTGAALHKLAVAGDKLESQVVWHSEVLLSKFQSSVLYKGKLYGCDQRAMKCVDFLTGKEEWTVGHVPNGTVLVADGHLVVLTEKGQLQIGPVSSSGFEPTTRADVLDGRCWSIPVLDDGRLYVRNLERVKCFKLRE